MQLNTRGMTYPLVPVKQLCAGNIQVRTWKHYQIVSEARSYLANKITIQRRRSPCLLLSSCLETEYFCLRISLCSTSLGPSAMTNVEPHDCITGARLQNPDSDGDFLLLKAAQHLPSSSHEHSDPCGQSCHWRYTSLAFTCALWSAFLPFLLLNEVYFTNALGQK